MGQRGQLWACHLVICLTTTYALEYFDKPLYLRLPIPRVAFQCQCAKTCSQPCGKHIETGQVKEENRGGSVNVHAVLHGSNSSSYPSVISSSKDIKAVANASHSLPKKAQDALCRYMQSPCALHLRPSNSPLLVHVLYLLLEFSSTKVSLCLNCSAVSGASLVSY